MNNPIGLGPPVQVQAAWRGLIQRKHYTRLCWGLGVLQRWARGFGARLRARKAARTAAKLTHAQQLFSDALYALGLRFEGEAA